MALFDRTPQGMSATGPAMLLAPRAEAAIGHIGSPRVTGTQLRAFLAVAKAGSYAAAAEASGLSSASLHRAIADLSSDAGAASDRAARAQRPAYPGRAAPGARLRPRHGRTARGAGGSCGAQGRARRAHRRRGHAAQPRALAARGDNALYRGSSRRRDRGARGQPCRTRGAAARRRDRPDARRAARLLPRSRDWCRRQFSRTVPR